MENNESKHRIVITENFEKQAEEYFQYLAVDSPQQAKKFAEGLVPLIKQIALQPTSYPPEPHLLSQKNWYRFALHMKSWKVIFKLTNELLIFLGIIHTSRSLGNIKKLRTNKQK